MCPELILNDGLLRMGNSQSSKDVIQILESPLKRRARMRYILLMPTAWIAGMSAYYLALSVFFGETPTDVAVVFFSSFVALLVCIPVLYLPVLLGLRRLLGGWKPLIAFPITAMLLGIGPTAFVFLWWGGGELSTLFSHEAIITALSPEAALFYVLFAVVGLVLGLGVAFADLRYHQ